MGPASQCVKMHWTRYLFVRQCLLARLPPSFVHFLCFVALFVCVFVRFVVWFVVHVLLSFNFDVVSIFWFGRACTQKPCREFRNLSLAMIDARISIQ